MDYAALADQARNQAQPVDYAALADRVRTDIALRTPQSVGEHLAGKYPQAYAKPDAPQSVEDLVPKNLGKWGSAAVDFLKGSVGDTAQGAYEAAKRLLSGPKTEADKTAFSILGPLGPLAMDAARAQLGQAAKAKDAFQSGDYITAAGRGLAAALPVIGPAAANAGDNIGDGQIARGLGQGTALALSASPTLRAPLVSAAQTVGPAIVNVTGKAVGAVLHPKITAANAIINLLTEKLGGAAPEVATNEAVPSPVGEPIQQPPITSAPVEDVHAAVEQILKARPDLGKAALSEVATVDTPAPQEPPPAEAKIVPFDRSTLPPDNLKASEAFQKGYEAMKARRRGAPEASASPAEPKTVDGLLAELRSKLEDAGALTPGQHLGEVKGGRYPQRFAGDDSPVIDSYKRKLGSTAPIANPETITRGVNKANKMAAANLLKELPEDSVLMKNPKALQLAVELNKLLKGSK